MILKNHSRTARKMGQQTETGVIIQAINVWKELKKKMTVTPSKL